MTTPDPVPGARLLRLYPAAWRARYGDEMLALLADRRPGLRDRLDLVRGAWDAHAQAVETTSLAPVTAAITGAAWTIAGAVTVLDVAPPDWPGFTRETAAVAAVGCVAGAAFGPVVSGRLGDRAGRVGTFAVAAFVITQLVLACLLLVAVAGGPYGAITGAGLGLVAASWIVAGIALLVQGQVVLGPCLAVAGAALAVPAPGAWAIAGAAWTAIWAWWVVVRPRVPGQRAGPGGRLVA